MMKELVIEVLLQVPGSSNYSGTTVKPPPEEGHPTQTHLPEGMAWSFGHPWTLVGFVHMTGTNSVLAHWRRVAVEK